MHKCLRDLNSRYIYIYIYIYIKSHWRIDIKDSGRIVITLKPGSYDASGWFFNFSIKVFSKANVDLFFKEMWLGGTEGYSTLSFIASIWWICLMTLMIMEFFSYCFGSQVLDDFMPLHSDFSPFQAICSLVKRSHSSFYFSYEQGQA